MRIPIIGKNKSEENGLSRYYVLLRETGVIPNFWVSSTYWTLSKFECIEYEGGLSLQSNGIVMFPFIDTTTHKIITDPYFGDTNGIWTTFPGVEPDDPCTKEFLDNNDILDPKRFVKMKGKNFDVLREQVKKWPGENPDCTFYIHNSDGYPGWNEAQIQNFLAEWFKGTPFFQEKDEIFGNLCRYFLIEGNRGNCGYLFRDQNAYDLVGLVGWDFNWQFINFRFCVCRTDEKWLNEFLTWRFLVGMAGQERLVNSGGNVGGLLEQFKKNLNPTHTYPIYSWRGNQ